MQMLTYTCGGLLHIACGESFKCLVNFYGERSTKGVGAQTGVVERKRCRSLSWNQTIFRKGLALEK